MCVYLRLNIKNFRPVFLINNLVMEVNTGSLYLTSNHCLKSNIGLGLAYDGSACLNVPTKYDTAETMWERTYNGWNVYVTVTKRVTKTRARKRKEPTLSADTSQGNNRRTCRLTVCSEVLFFDVANAKWLTFMTLGEYLRRCGNWCRLNRSQFKRLNLSRLPPPLYEPRWSFACHW